MLSTVLSIDCASTW